MLTPKIRLNPSHRDDLATVCALGVTKLRLVCLKIETAPFTIRRSRIESTINDVVGAENGAALARVLFGIGSSFRRSFLSPEATMEGVTYSLGDMLEEDPRLQNWDECRGVLRRILETRTLILAAKALDISYDFERVYLGGRLLTSVRPVFDDRREEILGSTVVQTLRLEYLAANGDQSNISVAMDMGDIRRLKEECDRAIKKAEVAQARIEQDCGIEAIISGEDENG